MVELLLEPAAPVTPTIDDRFRALSVRDLLEAREAYHVHLSHMDNVVGTAVGLYRIRRCDLPASDPEHDSPVPRSKSTERTLVNSVVRGWSWPALLVFVEKWVEPEDFRGAPEQALPKRLYLPDGRVVPVCVIRAPEATEPDEREVQPRFSHRAIAGGAPIFTERQGRTEIGTVTCLVSDGSEVFALTNRHVAGEPGTRVSTLVNGVRVEVGRSVATQRGTVPFATAYPEWAPGHSLANVDAGLVRLDDVGCWTSEVLGIGAIGAPLDIDAHTLSLRLIGADVVGHGAASGTMHGEIQALFYRYRTIGGTDYVADLLIGPRAGQTFPTRPGDSGTLWFLEQTATADASDNRSGTVPLRPIAVQWGGHRVLGAGRERQLRFALATNLGTIRRLLGVELVREWGIGLPEYWGAVGHYTVGARACGLCSTPKLDKLMSKNRRRVSFMDDAIAQGEDALKTVNGFASLADVADLVWRTTRGHVKEGSQHFADMDLPGTGSKHAKFAGKSLLDLCKADPKNVDTRVWDQFYEDVGENDDAHRGSLPFRVWQMYEACVAFASEGDVKRFLCTAGTMAHYVGDACQPLHVSKLHHGRTAQENGVHTYYETTMLNDRAPELLVKVTSALGSQKANPKKLTGHQAAIAVVELMRSTVTTLPPLEIVETWASGPGTRKERMWSALGDRTAQIIAAGSLTLAYLWECAWLTGNGDAIPESDLVLFQKKTLRDVYEPDEFVPSRTLKQMVADGFGFAP